MLVRHDTSQGMPCMCGENAEAILNHEQGTHALRPGDTFRGFDWIRAFILMSFFASSPSLGQPRQPSETVELWIMANGYPGTLCRNTLVLRDRFDSDVCISGRCGTRFSAWVGRR